MTMRLIVLFILLRTAVCEAECAVHGRQMKGLS